MPKSLFWELDCGLSCRWAYVSTARPTHCCHMDSSTSDLTSKDVSHPLPRAQTRARLQIWVLWALAKNGEARWSQRRKLTGFKDISLVIVFNPERQMCSNSAIEDSTERRIHPANRPFSSGILPCSSHRQLLPRQNRNQNVPLLWSTWAEGGGFGRFIMGSSCMT